MRPVLSHDWNLSASEARDVQERLRPSLSSEDAVALTDVRLVAGVDNGYRQDETGSIAFAAIVLLTYPALETIEVATAAAPVTFPYVPGLLTFREAPAVLAAAGKLALEPDVILFDGQGIAHPRRFGLAAHLGLVFGKPSIGCAKSRLVGRYQEPADEFGALTPLMDRGETIGAAVRTRAGHAPLFVSQGHAISLSSAIVVVLACCRDGQFMPEPTRLAHLEVTRVAHPSNRNNWRARRRPAGDVPPRT
jgi:deoxyribonuclease V